MKKFYENTFNTKFNETAPDLICDNLLRHFLIAGCEYDADKLNRHVETCKKQPPSPVEHDVHQAVSEHHDLRGTEDLAADDHDLRGIEAWAAASFQDHDV